MGWKYKLAEWAICQRNRHSKGASEFGFIKEFIVFYGVIQLYLSLYLKLNLKWYVVILAMFGLMIGNWIFGWMWDRLGLFVIENEWGNKRNAFAIEVRKKFNLNNIKNSGGKSNEIKNRIRQ